MSARETIGLRAAGVIPSGVRSPPPNAAIYPEGDPRKIKGRTRRRRAARKRSFPLQPGTGIETPKRDTAVCVAELSVENYGAILPREDGFRYGRRMGHLLGYARVSTTDQDAALQIDALALAA